MGKLIPITFLTLDGVMQAPGGTEEDPSGGFAYGGWQVPFEDEEANTFITEAFDRVGAFLLGRRTYDIFSGYWPKQTDPDNAIAAKLNTLPKYVASTTLKDPEWAGTTVLGPDLEAEIARIKESTDGEVHIWGSGELVGWLLARGLIDELNLMVYPVVLGAGRRLFPGGGEPTTFEVTASRTTAVGVAIHTYRPAGRATFGTY
ncbi:dihydrofolate reductase family protein [Streptomyces sp. NBC_00536]|uniref:dihydrofolate reductase family protein n=1 Tax=Streptomyces sp. NBC_00536 TaxID=2975769 RepID=UPI002E7FEB7A|nr:dihydrofolate reductase family protein [Streptomyces sp. NBC_00536]WUC82119.1 dihydrofolate reductase family protein [Streptomyces sp. NBC_00536]